MMGKGVNKPLTLSLSKGRAPPVIPAFSPSFPHFPRHSRAGGNPGVMGKGVNKPLTLSLSKGRAPPVIPAFSPSFPHFPRHSRAGGNPGVMGKGVNKPLTLSLSKGRAGLPSPCRGDRPVAPTTPSPTCSLLPSFLPFSSFLPKQEPTAARGGAGLPKTQQKRGGHSSRPFQFKSL